MQYRKLSVLFLVLFITIMEHSPLLLFKIQGEHTANVYHYFIPGHEVIGT